MDVQRLDHVHIKSNDFRKTSDTLKSITGHEFLMEMEFEEQGMMVGYDPFPYSLEVMTVTDKSKSLAKLYEEWPEGVFCLTFKVPDYEAAKTEMEEKGYPQIERYDTPPIVKEGLFNTLKDLPFYIELVESPDDMANINMSDYE